MSKLSIASTILLLALADGAFAGGIDGQAVLGGAIGGGAGAALGSVVGGRDGAIIGAGVGGAAGAALATERRQAPAPRPEVRVVEREVVVVDEGCWPPGHCKHKKHKHKD